MNRLSLLLGVSLLSAVPMLAYAGIVVPEIDGGASAIAIALVGGLVALVRKSRRPK
jgi:hypothetical protein